MSRFIAQVLSPLYAAMCALGLIWPDRSPFDFDPVHSIAFGFLALMCVIAGFFASKRVGRRVVGAVAIVSLGFALMNMASAFDGVTTVLGGTLSPALGVLELLSGALAGSAALLTLED